MNHDIDIESSTTSPIQKRKWIRNVGVSLALLTTASIATAVTSTPVSASTTYGGCTVDPKDPAFADFDTS
jgi:hypothetical protein